MIQREDRGLRDIRERPGYIAVLLQKLTDMEPIRIPDPIYQPVKCGAVRSYKEPEKPA